MVHNSATATISRDRLISVLGTEISTADFTQLQARTQLLTIDPGSTFWHSSDGKPGIYIIVAGKVRLFNRVVQILHSSITAVDRSMRTDDRQVGIEFGEERSHLFDLD
jgi:hypothetical protein